MSQRPHYFHVFPGFGCGGTQLRVVRILNGIGDRARHTILALDGETGAAGRIDAGVRAAMVVAPARGGWYALRLRRTIAAHRPDLLLSYNWGSMEAVIGACLGPLCPVVHNECGFGADEAASLKYRRVLTRYVLLNRVHTTVVTSRAMLAVCRESFKLAAEKVRWIRTGVDTGVFHPGLPQNWRAEIGAAAAGELVIGFLGGLRPEKNLELLLRGFTAAGIPHARLALIGEGPCRPALEQLAAELGIAERVRFAGRAGRPELCLAGLDVFAMSSATEQTSNAMLEAMATGLPVVTTDVGDSRELLTGEGGEVTLPGDVQAYAVALRRLAASEELRRRAGAANRKRAVEEYSNERMVRAYAGLYEEAAHGSNRVCA